MAKRREHSIQRAKERYGISVTPRQLVDIAAVCKRSKWSAARIAAGGTEYHYVEIEGETLLALYSRKFNRVMTFLPPGQLWGPKNGNAKAEAEAFRLQQRAA